MTDAPNNLIDRAEVSELRSKGESMSSLYTISNTESKATVFTNLNSQGPAPSNSNSQKSRKNDGSLKMKKSRSNRPIMDN